MTVLFISIVTLDYCCSQLSFQSEMIFNKGAPVKNTEVVSLSHSASLPFKTAQMKSLTKQKDYFSADAKE